MNESLSAMLPLTETTFFILLSLAPGRRHGYAILKDVQVLSENRIIFSTGTLYGALKRLVDEGWIVRLEDGANEVGGRERKDYALTEAGRSLLKAEVARMSALVRVAGQRLPAEG